MALSRLVTLSISSLRNLDIEANKFYDRAHRLYDAALLTQCYTQHALRPYINSKINHIRHFIKIQFVNKGIEFINLPSTFKDKSGISSIPTYFENKESPIICYKYNKPIRSTVFNYNKLVTELDVEHSFLTLEIVKTLSIAINQLVIYEGDPGINANTCITF